jgi:hypothetical protein
LLSSLELHHPIWPSINNVKNIRNSEKHALRQWKRK